MLLCYFAKVCEIILHSQIYPLVKQHILLYQPGSVGERPTLTNLLCFTEYVSTAFYNRRQIDVECTDFSKAFDTVDDNIISYLA